MIKIEKTVVCGWEPAIRGMRNPMNSWAKSDSVDRFAMNYEVGKNDADLMKRLCKGGPVHAKFRRMITVYVDITAPLYWWKEFDTYKVGTVANSCSTMHKIHAKEFTLDDFSSERLSYMDIGGGVGSPHQLFQDIVRMLNECRELYLQTREKCYWWQMIQLLPTSYNQLRTVELNYEVLHNIYHSRLNHKLNEWHSVCEWIESLPHSWIITGKENEDGET